MVSAKTMARICRWLVAAVVGSTTAAAHAAIQATVSSSEIDETEAVELNIRAEALINSEPDTTPLLTDWEIVSSQTNRQFSMINGRMESWVDYRYVLKPRRIGKLTVPMLTAGGETTPVFTVQVNPLDPQLKDAIATMVFFEQTLSPDPVYVQSELILERRFYYSRGVQLYTDLPGLPEIPGAVVLPIGKTESTTEMRSGREYGLIRQRFALFPQSSGPLEIPRVSVTTSVRVRHEGRIRRNGVDVATAPQRVTVLPIPEGYPADQPFLAARSVHLDEAWQLPDGEERLVAGQPLVRQLMVRADGAIGSAIPPLPEAAVAGLKQYPEPPEIEDQDTGRGVIGVRRERTTMIPTAAGTLDLPAVSVTWFDIDDADVRTSRIAATRFEIAAMPGDDADTAGNAQTAADATPTRTPDVRPAAPEGHTDWRMLITVLAATGLVVLAVLGWRARRRQTLDMAAATARLFDLLPIGLRRQLRARRALAALDGATPQVQKRVLIDWFASARDISRASAASELTRDPQIGPVIANLNALAYGDASTASPHDDQRIRDYVREFETRRRDSETTSALPDFAR